MQMTLEKEEEALVFGNKRQKKNYLKNKTVISFDKSCFLPKIDVRFLPKDLLLFKDLRWRFSQNN